MYINEYYCWRSCCSNEAWIDSVDFINILEIWCGNTCANFPKVVILVAIVFCNPTTLCADIGDFIVGLLPRNGCNSIGAYWTSGCGVGVAALISSTMRCWLYENDAMRLSLLVGLVD